MKRLFIAIPVPLTDELDIFYNSLREIAPHPQVKWVEPQNLHLTLKFLGNIEETKIPAIKGTLVKAADKNQSFVFEIKKTGAFPDRKGNFRVIHLKTEPAEPFIKLYKVIDFMLTEAGFTFRKDRFSPHITVGRVKSLKNNSEMKEFIDRHQNLSLNIMKADHFELIESKLTSRGPVYTTIESFNLK